MPRGVAQELAQGRPSFPPSKGLQVARFRCSMATPRAFPHLKRAAQRRLLDDSYAPALSSGWLDLQLPHGDAVNSDLRIVSLCAPGKLILFSRFGFVRQRACQALTRSGTGECSLGTDGRWRHGGRGLGGGRRRGAAPRCSGFLGQCAGPC